MGYLDRAQPARKRKPDPTRVRTSKTYKNVGHKSVHGLPPGETGKLELTEGEAAALVQAGLLVLVVESNGPRAKDKEAR